MFDDFTYGSTQWVSDSGTNTTLNSGSLFGWNVWSTSIGSGSTTRDRLWYRSFTWFERSVPAQYFMRSSGSQISGTEYGSVTLRAPAGYTGPVDSQIEILSGFLAREGTWAARINFSDLDDVRSMAQSFWTHGAYSAVAINPDDSNLRKYQSEMDHEFNNWFHHGWTTCTKAGVSCPGGSELGSSYFSDNGGVHVATGYFEGPGNEGLHEVPMFGHPWPDGVVLPENHCKLIRNGSQEYYRLSPASCSSIIEGDAPRLIYGRPVLDEDIAVDLLISNQEGKTLFQIQASWWATQPDGSGQDYYYFHMGSEVGGGGPGVSQPMAAKFSQYLWDGAHGVEFDGRPLLRTHDMVLDWFYFSPNPDLNLNDIGSQVSSIRSAGVRRLNTTGRPLHRPYTNGVPDQSPAVYINHAPSAVGSFETANFVGSYAHRAADLRLLWQYRYQYSDGTRSAWSTKADRWFRESISFPQGGAVQQVEVRLRVGEYGPTAFENNWLPKPSSYVSQVVTYGWNGSQFVCQNCAQAQEPIWTVSGSRIEAPVPGPALRADTPETFEVSDFFPNPSTGQVMFEIANPYDVPVSAIVYDAAGRLVLRQAWPGPSGVTERSLDVSHLPTGVYVARVASGPDTAVKRFTVIR